MSDAPSMVVNPYSGEVFDFVTSITAADADGVVRAARQAQDLCGAISLAQRCTLCEAFLRVLQGMGDTLARQISMQMGKPLTEALAEVRVAIAHGKALVAMADNALGEVWLPEENGVERAVQQAPLGVVADFPSWTHPLLLPVRTLIPAILGGNAVILKPSNNAVLTAPVIAAAFEAAGAPSGLVQHVVGDAGLAAALAAHPGVDAIAFSGSTADGAVLRRHASEHPKRLVFELGGNDAAFVCADADLEAAAMGLARGAFENAGQNAWSVKRIYVEKTVYKDFAECFVERAKALVMGDPLRGATTLGPLALEDGPADLIAVMDEAVEGGGEMLAGPDDFDFPETGWFFPPAVIANAPQSCALMQRECLGPVVGLAPVEGDEQAIERMNDSDLGVSASVWTQDADRTMRLASDLEVGTVFLNETGVQDPALPWAPAKASGQGVMLSPWGLHQFTRSRALHLRTGPALR